MAIQVTLKNFGKQMDKCYWAKKVIVAMPFAAITLTELSKALCEVAKKYDVEGTIVMDVRFVNVEVIQCH